MKILVVAGGLSSEYEVSLASGIQVYKALKARSHDVNLLDISKGIVNVKDNNDFAISLGAPKALAVDSKNQHYICENFVSICKEYDVVFLGLHGSIGESGHIQSLLDIHHIKYTGSSPVGCTLSYDKTLSKKLVSNIGISTAISFEVSKTAECENIIGIIPDNKNYFVKPVTGGSSIGVSYATNKEQLQSALSVSLNYDFRVMIEEEIKGLEVSCAVLNGRSLTPISVSPTDGFFSYDNKYQRNGAIEQCPPLLSKNCIDEIQRATLAIHNELKLGYYSRIDFIVENCGRIVFLEANSLPGLTMTSLLPQEALFESISFEHLCELIASNPVEHTVFTNFRESI